jgi:hypothetical protein
MDSYKFKARKVSHVSIHNLFSYFSGLLSSNRHKSELFSSQQTCQRSETPASGGCWKLHRPTGQRVTETRPGHQLSEYSRNVKSGDTHAMFPFILRVNLHFPGYVCLYAIARKTGGWGVIFQFICFEEKAELLSLLNHSCIRHHGKTLIKPIM